MNIRITATSKLIKFELKYAFNWFTTFKSKDFLSKLV